MVVEDVAMPENVDVLFNGVDNTPVERLSPGLSVTYQTVVRPLQTGMMILGPVRVSYMPDVDSTEKQVGVSTVVAVNVLTTNEYIVSKILLMVPRHKY